MSPECPVCLTSMSLTSRDEQWHICPECFTQEPRDNGKPRSAVYIPTITDD
jgi:hypothetical protein